ncbi:MAG: hypothetical protein AAF416_19395 [Pseudomonadota bacterium]
MSEKKKPKNGATTTAKSTAKGPKPYSEMSGLNAEIEKRRGAEDASSAPAATMAVGASGTDKSTPPGAKPAAGRPATPSPTPEAASKRANATPAAPERSTTGGWLALLLGLVVGAVGILAAAPFIAPHMPRPIAEFLTQRGTGPDPAVEALNARVAALESAAVADADDPEAEDIVALQERLSAVEAQTTAVTEAIDAAAEDDGETAATEEALDAIAERVSAAEAGMEERISAVEGLAGQIQSLTGQVTSQGEDIATLGERIDAVQGASPAVTGAAFAALADKVDNRATREATAELGARLTALENRAEPATAAELASLANRLAAIETGLEDARAAQARAEEALEAARTDASRRALARDIQAAGARLAERLIAGDSYAAPLVDLEELAGGQAPAALSASAGEGLTAPVELANRFSAAAQAAIRADLAVGGDGGSNPVLGWLQSQVTVRSTEVREGDDVEAILSRVEAAFRTGRDAEALAEAETLPAYAQEASPMAGWIEDLKERVEARQTLDAWLAEIGPADNG